MSVFDISLLIAGGIFMLFLAISLIAAKVGGARSSARRSAGMPFMLNAFVYALLAVSTAISAALINGLVTPLGNTGWTVVGSVMTLLIFGFTECVKTNVYLIRRQAGAGGEGDDGD